MPKPNYDFEKRQRDAAKKAKKAAKLQRKQEVPGGPDDDGLTTGDAPADDQPATDTAAKDPA